MKVGDLVRHFMYSDTMPTAIVLKIRFAESREHADHILVHDKGDTYWDRMSEYEVISESR